MFIHSSNRNDKEENISQFNHHYAANFSVTSDILLKIFPMYSNYLINYGISSISAGCNIGAILDPNKINIDFLVLKNNIKDKI